jgi:hypothetical protein
MISINHLTRHGFRAYFKNLRNSIRAEINNWQRKRGAGAAPLTPPIDYTPTWIQEFKTALNRDEWHLGQPWGDFHPDHLNQYYDTTGQLAYVAPEGLILELRKQPKKYIKSQLPDWRQSDKLPDEFTIPVGVGLVVSKRAWHYGWFEAWIQLPKGQTYWNAFWFSGKNSWPPEIDVFEGYSDEGPNYESSLFGRWFKRPHRRIQPNLHYGVIEDGTKKQYLPYNVPVYNATERLVQYVCHWEADFIKIYYDGVLVFECTDPKVLQWYNRELDEQHVIFNHGLHEHHPENPTESAMIIGSFKVYQKSDI